ncbi:MAG TPA: peptidoglycan editing factor PgeF [Bryobacteraceae bacterium]|nr:peptidoglycan editing factor PgeF [Bryobacteraceae bacterium]
MSDFLIDSKGIYRCKSWSEFVWQKHEFGARQANPTPAVTLRQIHSARVREAESGIDRLEGDGLVTDQVGLSIGIRTADCLPILLLDPRSRAVGAVHAGWRGSAGQIIVHAIDQLQARYGARPAEIQAAIGPCIRACCYEVGADVAERFRRWLPGLHSHLDLVEANKMQMIEAGVSPQNIFDSGLCTFCHPDQLFSYRREPTNPGRQISAIERIT